ncbi:hypothetical protein D3C80_1786710 [compost metagenome]
MDASRLFHGDAASLNVRDGLHGYILWGNVSKLILHLAPNGMYSLSRNKLAHNCVHKRSEQIRNNDAL